MKELLLPSIGQQVWSIQTIMSRLIESAARFEKEGSLGVIVRRLLGESDWFLDSFEVFSGFGLRREGIDEDFREAAASGAASFTGIVRTEALVVA